MSSGSRSHLVTPRPKVNPSVHPPRRLPCPTRQPHHPPIDDLLEKVSSKYALAIYAAKCATSTPTALASQTPPPDILDKTRKGV
jgi:hypothetical protein